MGSHDWDVCTNDRIIDSDRTYYSLYFGCPIMGKTITVLVNKKIGRADCKNAWRTCADFIYLHGGDSPIPSWRSHANRHRFHTNASL